MTSKRDIENRLEEIEDEVGEDEVVLEIERVVVKGSDRVTDEDEVVEHTDEGFAVIDRETNTYRC